MNKHFHEQAWQALASVPNINDRRHKIFFQNLMEFPSTRMCVRFKISDEFLDTTFYVRYHTIVQTSARTWRLAHFRFLKFDQKWLFLNMLRSLRRLAVVYIFQLYTNQCNDLKSCSNQLVCEGIFLDVSNKIQRVTSTNCWTLPRTGRTSVQLNLFSFYRACSLLAFHFQWLYLWEPSTKHDFPSLRHDGKNSIAVYMQTALLSF